MYSYSSKMMRSFGMGRELETIEKIFWVLDKDDSGELDYIEFMLGVQMMKQSLQSSFKDKMLT